MNPTEQTPPENDQRAAPGFIASTCWAHSPAPSDLWKACAQVIREEGKPLEIWRVAKATGKAESEIIAALIRESRSDMAVSFRFPPIPRAAITHLGMPNLLLASDSL